MQVNLGMIMMTELGWLLPRLMILGVPCVMQLISPLPFLPLPSPPPRSSLREACRLLYSADWVSVFDRLWNKKNNGNNNNNNRSHFGSSRFHVLPCSDLRVRHVHGRCAIALIVFHCFVVELGGGGYGGKQSGTPVAELPSWFIGSSPVAVVPLRFI